MKKEIETRENCNICGKEFLMPHICIECRQERNLVTEQNLLQINSSLKLISIKDIKDGDVIILECLEINEEINKEINKITKKILEVTQKKVMFIVLPERMKIDHIPEAKLKSIGLAKIKKEDKGKAEIW